MKTFIVVDITGCEDIFSIKKVIFSQLRIEQCDIENYVFHVAEIGQKELGMKYLTMCNPLLSLTENKFY